MNVGTISATLELQENTASIGKAIKSLNTVVQAIDKLNVSLDKVDASVSRLATVFEAGLSKVVSANSKAKKSVDDLSTSVNNSANVSTNSANKKVSDADRAAKALLREQKAAEQLVASQTVAIGKVETKFQKLSTTFANMSGASEILNQVKSQVEALASVGGTGLQKPKFDVIKGETVEAINRAEIALKSMQKTAKESGTIVEGSSELSAMSLIRQSQAVEKARLDYEKFAVTFKGLDGTTKYVAAAEKAMLDFKEAIGSGTEAESFAQAQNNLKNTMQSLNTEAKKVIDIEKAYASQAQSVKSVDDAWKQHEKTLASVKKQQENIGFKRVGKAQSKPSATPNLEKEAIQQNDKMLDAAQRQADALNKAKLKVEQLSVAYSKLSDPLKVLHLLNKALKDFDSEMRSDAPLNKLDFSKAGADFENTLKKARIEADRLNQSIKGTGGSSAGLKSMEEQNRALDNAAMKVKALELSYSRLENSKTYTKNLNTALERLRNTLGQTGLTKEQYTQALHEFNGTLSETAIQVKKANPELAGLNLGFGDLSRTAVVTFGPLSGIGSRIIALTGIAKDGTLGIAALIGVLAGLSAIGGKAITTFAAADVQLRSMEGAVKLLGGSSNETADSLNRIAINLAEATLTSTQFAREAVVALQAFGNIGDRTEEIVNLAQDMSQALGGSGLLENTRKLGKVLEDPIRGMESLSEAGILFTKSEKKVIEALQAAGKGAEATDVVLNKLKSRVGGLAKEAAGGLAGAWDTMGERFTAFLEALGGAEEKTGTLSNTINNISAALQKWTKDTELAERVGASLGTLLGGLASTIQFVVTHIEMLTNALVFYMAGSIASKVIPAIFALDKATGLTKFTFIGLTAATNGATRSLVLFNKAINLNPIVFIAGTIASVALEMTLFADKQGDVVKSTEKLNKVTEETVEVFSKLDSVMTSTDWSPVVQKSQEVSGKMKQELENTALWVSALQIHLQNVDGEAAKTVSGILTQAIAKMNRDALEFTAAMANVDYSVQQLASAKSFEDSEKVFENQANSLLKSRDAALKYRNVMSALSNMKEKGPDRFTEEMQLLLHNLKSLESFNGFSDIKYQIEDNATAIELARKKLNAYKVGGEDAAKAVEDSFKRQAIAVKVTRDVFAKSADEVRSLANGLGLAAESEDIVVVQKAVTNALIAQEQAAFDLNKRFTDIVAKKDDFKKIAETIEEMGNALEYANQKMALVAMGGEAAAYALDETFKDNSAILKWVNSLKGIEDSELNVWVKELNLNLKEGENKVLAVANALGTMENATRRAEDATSMLADNFNQAQELFNALMAREGLSPLDAIFRPEHNELIIRLRESMQDFNKKLVEMSAVGGEAGVWEMVDGFEALADKVGMAQELFDVDTSNLEEVSRVLAKIKTKAEEMQDPFYGMNEVYRNVMEDMKSATDSWASGATDALTTFVNTGKLSFSDLANSIIQDLIRISIRRAVVEPAFNMLGTAISGFISPGSSIASGFGTAASSSAVNVASSAAFQNTISLPSKAGGGFTGTGTRTGGVDGKGGFPVIMHPQETVIDHYRGGSLGSSSNTGDIIINAPVTVTGGNVQQGGDYSRLGVMINEAVKAVIVREQRPGGLLSG